MSSIEKVDNSDFSLFDKFLLSTTTTPIPKARQTTKKEPRKRALDSEDSSDEDDDEDSLVKSVLKKMPETSLASRSLNKKRKEEAKEHSSKRI